MTIAFRTPNQIATNGVDFAKVSGGALLISVSGVTVTYKIGPFAGSIVVGTDTVIIDGVTFSGTATELKNELEIIFGGQDPQATSVIKIKTVTLTDSQIKAIGANTIITLVDTPPQDKIIAPIALYIILKDWAVNYGNIAANNNWYGMYDGDAAFPIGQLDQSTSQISDLLAGNGDRIVVIPMQLEVISGLTRIGMEANLADVVGKSLQLNCTNGSGAFTGGSQNTTLTFKTIYTLL